ncbi:hypothetical protein BGZ95_001787 [Linnemannia exigua]|uniref:Uncharacterized protein n=1 Tax=Linnemannia exigua TaxID=604196 RepID=A0AAD4D6Z2_9FUNG|nr:hypothetical protein BGZ95_001787 [Linnemannia exigua]
MIFAPSYAGTDEDLPEDIIVLAYFRTTKISEWSLEDFLTSTGLTEVEFMSGLKDIARIKRLPSEVQFFAKRLKDYYGGFFEEEVTEIAKNNARKTVNRELLSGKEHLLLQRKVNDAIERDVGSEQTANLEVSAKRTKRRKTEKDAQTTKNAIQETKVTKDVEVLASPTQANQGESSTLSSTLSSLSNSRAKSDHGRRSSVSGQEYVDVKAFWIYPNEFDIFYYVVKSANVGRAFNNYQVTSLTIVNKSGTMVTVSNLSSFLSMNYIWDLHVILPDMDKDTYLLIQKKHTWPHSVVPEAVVRLCGELDEQLATGQDVEAEVEKGLRSVRLLYEVLALKLPLEYLPFERGLEDTYCHGVIDALLTRQFPARSKYRLDWANKEAGGSKERRVNGYKPDGIISSSSNHRELAFLEVKPPKEQHCKRAFLEDLWKLANYCKDAIDSNLRQGIQIRKAAAVQVFGHRMALYTMVYDHGIYHWSKSCIAYLPCDQTDTGRIPSCLRLLTTLEDFLESIFTNIDPSTPPLFDYDDSDEHPLQDTGRVSKVTPTKRPMF